MTEPLIEGTESARREIDYIGDNEMVETLEDYQKRRSKLEYLLSYQELKNLKGIYEACEHLFGDKAQAQYDAYFSR